MKNNLSEYSQFNNLVKDSEDIILTSHINPDRDAIGSLVSMKFILEQLGFKPKVILESKHNIQDGFLEGLDSIVFDDLENHSDNADLIIILDQNNWQRVTKLDREKYGGKLIIIDHHETKLQTEDCDLYIRDVRTSCCEVIYNLFQDKVQLDNNILKPILMGMYDDTGGFSYPGVTSKTFSIVSDILQSGIEIHEISEESKGLDLNVFMAGKTIYNHFEFHKKHDHFSTFITQEVLDKYELSYNDIESIKESFLKILLNIREFKWGYLIKPKPNGDFSVNFRSKSNGPNVRMIAEYFGGGGHDRASGAVFKNSSPREIIKQIESKLDDLLLNKNG